jgi:4-hydroxyphenylacetate 3-hydroxylase N terminal/Fumarylacetoacetate (FAA) hydrolase family
MQDGPCRLGGTTLPARNGQQFLDGLKAPREIYVGDERVTDVASHPAFSGAAEELSSVFDLQHAEAARCLVPDPEIGELINASHLIPRSREDLFKRHAALEVCAEHIRESRVRTYINGKVVQGGPASEMTFDIPYIMAHLSRHITFLPGDVVLSGTPANSRPMSQGDVVEVEVTGVGRVSNTVQETPALTHKIGHQPTNSHQVRAVALGQFPPRPSA